MRRRWVQSGVIEDFDARQQRLLDLVLDAVHHYYQDLYQTRSCYDQPLSLSRLMKLTRRSGSRVLAAVRVLANTIADAQTKPPPFYVRVQSERNPSKRPYQILLRNP